MTLILPQFVVLDTATLGRVAKDYWDEAKAPRDKARDFLGALLDSGTHIVFTLTHVLEILRHDQAKTARDRIRFLRAIPLIAWLRPYDRSWFPGGLPDLLQREIDAVIRQSTHDWRSIIDHVRPELWETGTGAEMFV